MKSDRDIDEALRMFAMLTDEEREWFLDRLRECLERQKREERESA